MDDKQDLTYYSGKQLNQTGNPQLIGRQALVSADNSIQVSSSSVLTLPDATIKSVGSTQFQPVNVLASSTNSLSDDQLTTSPSPAVLFASISIIAVLLISLIIVAVRNDQKPVITDKNI